MIAILWEIIISNNIIQADGAVSLAANVHLTSLVAASNHIKTGGIIAEAVTEFSYFRDAHRECTANISRHAPVK